MNELNLSQPRWGNYFLQHGTELFEFWSEYLAKGDRRILFVMGRGFDPRMCLGISRLFQLDGITAADVRVIQFDEGATSPSVKFSDHVAENMRRLEDTTYGKALTTVSEIPMWSYDARRRIGSNEARKLFGSVADLGDATDVIVDVSSLPRSIYIPLVAKLLYLLDDAKTAAGIATKNLHVWVSENPDIDAKITDEEIDEQAEFMDGFRGGLDMEAHRSKPTIWIPFLGEGQKTQLERINNLLQPDEICPVLPSPSRDPRRGDNLILEYREFLFDTLTVDPRNFIYAAERNPFEVYRQVRRTILHYHEALKSLHGCKTGISAQSTKLMSLGALLVAYELKSLQVGIAHVEADGYNVAAGVYDPEIVDSNDIFGLWLFGECYET